MVDSAVDILFAQFSDVVHGMQCAMAAQYDL